LRSGRVVEVGLRLGRQGRLEYIGRLGSIGHIPNRQLSSSFLLIGVSLVGMEHISPLLRRIFSLRSISILGFIG
jgi:hypothetical protein